MKIKYILPKIALLFTLIVVLASCEEDFSTLGADVIGDTTIDSQFTDENSVVAYSRKLAPVQSNNLPLYQLGTYTDPTYGKSTINLLSQLTLDRNDPSFGENVEVESVILYIPYFSTATQTTGGVTYTLDSVFGTNPIDITLSRSNFLLRDFDPTTGFEERQKYFSNQGPVFENFIGEEIFKIEDFIIKPEGFIENEGTDDEQLISPGLRVELPTAFFKELIIDNEGQDVLLNNNNFKNFFRGIYFEVDATGADNNLFLFNIANAEIAINYTADDPNNAGERDDREFVLEFGGVNVNVFDNQLSQDVATALSEPDFTNGEENLYLRGGDGVIGVVELFGQDADNNGVADELEILREREWIINEANLIFYVDDTKIEGGDTEPERIVIYDLKNNGFLIDYNRDASNTLDALNSRTNHLGRLERGSDAIGDFYKIKVTNHISNLINRDSTNVPLGLMVSQNVLLQQFQDTRNVQSPFISAVPSSSVISPEGTVLFGNATTNEEKRLRLQIFYTEPN